jgi:site-specific recombinase XerD
MTSKPDRLLRLVESFFRDYLAKTRGVSPHTIKAYRDTLRLFFVFAAEKRRCDVSDLRLIDLKVELVSSFLDHLEEDRENTAASRNCRLSALRSFFRHLVRNDLPHAGQYERVLELESRQARIRPASYLEAEEIRLILAQPDTRTKAGARDRALLLFLYNTGARISEALSVRATDLKLHPPRHVCLHGKGGRERICPLWRETVSALQSLPTLRDSRPGDLIFRSLIGEPLTRDGAAYILHKYATAAARTTPALRRRHITPHTLRHSCAVSLLQAGIDVTVIRDYLGHASIKTTNRYITSNLKMKREALETFWRHSGLSPERVEPWKPTPDLLKLLSSL